MFHTSATSGKTMGKCLLVRNYNYIKKFSFNIQRLVRLSNCLCLEEMSLEKP